MHARLKSFPAAWVAPAAIVIVAAGVVAFAPAEQTLGQAVKVIYVHVALSRAGGIGFVAAGLLGLAVIITRRQRLADWMRSVGWAALGLFAGGLLISVVAQAVSWGGIAWDEPRVAAALNLLAAAVIVQGLEGWIAWTLGRALLRIGLAALQVWTTLRAVNVLHPGDAIRTSSSTAIQATGAILLALALLLGAWIAWWARPDGQSPDRRE